MNTDTRRKRILEVLLKNKNPISATKLASQFAISRQVIVGDIAILRAAGKNIVSTPRGYILESSNNFPYIGTICARHNKNDIYEELITIVDFGGTCIDISVKHKVYGEITKPLGISSRYEVQKFLEKTDDNKPLSSLSDGVHYHNIGTDSEEIFNLIKNELIKKGICVK